MTGAFVLLGSVLDATVKGALLVAAAAVITWLIGDRIAARWRHALWLVVILRFAMPVAPSSRWSVFNLFAGESRVPVAMVSGAPSTTIHVRVAGGEPMLVAEAKSWMPVVWPWAFGLWIAVAIALLLRAIVAAVRVGFSVRRRRQAAALRVEGVTLPVVETHLVDAPALHGLIRPVLLLPARFGEAFGDGELRHVALHELWHLRRLDVAVNWLLTVVEAIHWFNPLVWFAASRIREERELACDELALSCLEEDERDGYGRTILKLLERCRTAAPVPALVGIVGHKKKMKRRIQMIATYTKRTRVPLLFVAALAVIAVGGLTDARGGERHMMLKELDPAAAQTFEKLGKRVTLDVKDASFGELLNVVSNATGVVITQAPELASSPIQQARFTFQAQDIPVHALLHASLLPFHVAPKPDANGLTIAPLADGDHGEQHIVMHREMAGHGEGAGEGTDGMKKITMRISNDSKSAVTADGTLHREVTCDIEENGVPSHGKLVLDISGVK